MKEVTTLTVRQNPCEPRLKVRLYRGDVNFYIRVESNHPAIPPSMPMRIEATNFKEAKDEAGKFLHLIRGVFRQALGKAADLPEDMKEIEAEIPAFLDYLLTNSFVGQN